MSNNTATFFLSTGRCGTQWLAANLSSASKGAAVEHEPLHERYYPRIMRASNNPQETGNAAEILSHCERIENTLREKSYIECGWPAWGALPFLLRRFEGRIRIVHLVRHPVHIACSWVSHGAFCPPIIPGMPGFQEKILASPFDQGSRFSQYRQNWQDMNPFEKSLLFWAEVNSLGLTLANGSHAPWLLLRFEDLFHRQALENLADFLGIAQLEDFRNNLKQSKDDFRYLCNTWWNPKDIRKYPEVMALAEGLGYDPLDFSESDLRQRYFPFN